MTLSVKLRLHRPQTVRPAAVYGPLTVLCFQLEEERCLQSTDSFRAAAQTHNPISHLSHNTPGGGVTAELHLDDVTQK